jgi:hypothetical protein
MAFAWRTYISAAGIYCLCRDQLSWSIISTERHCETKGVRPEARENGRGTIELVKPRQRPVLLFLITVQLVLHVSCTN